MANSIQLVSGDGDIQTPEEFISSAQRVLAANILAKGQQQIFVEPVGKKMTAVEWFSIMIWDFITTGNMQFADGRALRAESPEQWLAMVKFVAAHVDGPSGREMPMGVNIFKVYMGVETDRV